MANETQTPSTVAEHGAQEGRFLSPLSKAASVAPFSSCILLPICLLGGHLETTIAPIWDVTCLPSFFHSQLEQFTQTVLGLNDMAEPDIIS